MAKSAHKKPEDYLRRHKDLNIARGNFLTLWDSCAQHILPDRAEFLTKRQVGDEHVTLYESAAIDANFTLAGWLWSKLSSPYIHWFKASVRNKAKKDLWPVKRWFDETDEIMYSTFSQSNFYDSLFNLYLDLGAFGTAPLYMSSKIAPYRQYFKQYSIRDALIAEDQFGVIDTVYREFKFTVRQMLLRFGNEALSESTKLLAHDKKFDEEIDILHISEPRKNRNEASDLSNQMPFESIYMEKKAKHILSASGYKTFPHVVGRFYRWGQSAYGRSPGMLALPDLRTADQMDKTNIIQGHKTAAPPLNVPGDMVGRVRTTPDALNFKGPSGDGIDPINLGNGLPFSIEMQDRRVKKIRDKFFADIILMLDNSGNVYKNIPEIMAREQEKMAVLGAPVGKLMDQVLGPVVEWSFMDHLENGMFPPVPQELDGEDLDIEYISPLAMMFKQLEGSGIGNAYELSRAAMEIDPSAAVNVDANKIIRKAFTIYGASDVLRSPEEVHEIRLQEQQTAQAEQAAQGLTEMVEGVKTLAQADQASGGKLGEALEE
jgi:hypothetical protein